VGQHDVADELALINELLESKVHDTNLVLIEEDRVNLGCLFLVDEDEWVIFAIHCSIHTTLEKKISNKP
jgi:hypothetical protein